MESTFQFLGTVYTRVPNYKTLFWHVADKRSLSQPPGCPPPCSQSARSPSLVPATPRSRRPPPLPNLCTSPCRPRPPSYWCLRRQRGRKALLEISTSTYCRARSCGAAARSLAHRLPAADAARRRRGLLTFANLCRCAARRSPCTVRLDASSGRAAHTLARLGAVTSTIQSWRILGMMPTTATCAGGSAFTD